VRGPGGKLDSQSFLKLENKEHGISDTDGEPETIEYMPSKLLKNHRSTANIVRTSKSNYSNSVM
jgi:hypothetical protein